MLQVAGSRSQNHVRFDDNVTTTELSKSLYRLLHVPIISSMTFILHAFHTFTIFAWNKIIIRHKHYVSALNI